MTPQHPAPMADAQIAEALTQLPGWERHGNAIARTFDRQTFNGAIAFVNTIGELAERAGHHPDLEIRYSRVRVQLSTHDVGGLSALDFQLARSITAAAQ